MSDFQALALFIFCLLLLSTHILNKFYEWQIKHEETRNISKLKFDPEAKFEKLAKNRINTNDTIREASKFLNSNLSTQGKFTVYDTKSGDIYQYYQEKIDYKE